VTGAHGTATLALVAACAMFLLGCGDTDTRSSVAVRVGPSVVTPAEVAHWASNLGPRHVVPDRAQSQVLRRRALDFLITSHWLIDGAAEQGLRVSAGEVHRRVAEVRNSFASTAQFEEAQRVIARTKQDLELEIAAQLASRKLRSAGMDRAPAVTVAEVAARYRRDIKHFENPERRYFYLVEALKSRAIAERLIAEYRRGKSIAGESFHERLDRPRSLEAARKIVKVLFALKPAVISNPIEINGYFFIAEVTRIIPPSRRTLAQARGSIGAKLTAERRMRALAAAIARWRSRWIAHTDCRPGFVVEKCRQFAGPRPPASSLSFG
jgi:hypothetical protein